MFALQEHRSVAGVVSVIVHAGVLTAAIIGAQHAGSGTPPTVILPDSAWVIPTGTPSGPGGDPVAPTVPPVNIPAVPGLPTLPGIPTVPGPSFPISVPGGWGPSGLDGTDSTIFDPRVTDDPPQLLSAPVPAYPPLLRDSGIQGVVTVQSVIDTLGRAEPASLRVVNSPHPGFDRPALDCVRRALFRPGRVHGRAVRVLVSIPLHFTLRP